MRPLDPAMHSAAVADQRFNLYGGTLYNVPNNANQYNVKNHVVDTPPKPIVDASINHHFVTM